MSEEKVRKILNAVQDPVTEKALESFKAVKSVTLNGKVVSATIALGYPMGSVGPVLREWVEKALLESGYTPGVITIDGTVERKRVHGVLKTLPKIKNIIVVASGKGGVGKSTVAANVALSLHAEGASVGLLDADIYGPSQPTMMGAKSLPESVDGKAMKPVLCHGVEVNSIGFFVEDTEPVIWRGPMASGTLTEILNKTLWSDLDYLVIDMPPGTGDIQLTLSQNIPVTGAIIVTTPQDISYIDAAKGLAMFNKVSIKVLGVVENMALFKCPKCGHLERIFGEGAAKKMTEQFGVEVIGELPLEARIREVTDAGTPTVISDPESEAAAIYRTIAIIAAAKLAMLPKDYSQVMPSVKTEKV